MYQQRTKLGTTHTHKKPKKNPTNFPNCFEDIQTKKTLILDFRKPKNTRITARVVFTLFSSLTTSSVFGLQYPNTGIHLVFLNERITGTRLREVSEVRELQYGFMKGKGTIHANGL